MSDDDRSALWQGRNMSDDDRSALWRWAVEQMGLPIMTIGPAELKQAMDDRRARGLSERKMVTERRELPVPAIDPEPIASFIRILTAEMNKGATTIQFGVEHLDEPYDERDEYYPRAVITFERFETGEELNRRLIDEAQSEIRQKRLKQHSREGEEAKERAELARLKAKYEGK